MENEILKENFNKSIELMSQVWWLDHDLNQLIFMWNKNWDIPCFDDEMYTYEERYKKLEKRTQKYQDKVKTTIQNTVTEILEKMDTLEKRMESLKKQMVVMKEFNK